MEHHILDKDLQIIHILDKNHIRIVRNEVFQYHNFHILAFFKLNYFFGYLLYIIFHQ